MIDFEKQDIDKIICIIDEYKKVSSELNSSMKKAKEIQEDVERLKKRMEDILKTENSFMESLHAKYGEFSLQDIYDIIRI